ncbi:AbrB family transcriptional regulator (plasmid) [Limosilactobacillus reuteri]|uniref:AbrB family transcriptional regulator n=1 Tax=Limosilactobacillus reuteri TaxID=1598 RepID=A0A517D8B2_LIMRT|nr:AbrB family transcriptional regulator [Limosilactobacillus reuteri]QDR73592.1 AbrB family transcriptional regulator [Limosilactobacillus reuteri]
MDTVKTRQQGNTIAVTLSKKFNIPAGEEYYITKSDTGVITLVPKVKDIFVNVQEGQYSDADEDGLARNFTPKGSELDD